MRTISLAFLAASPRQVFSRDQLLHQVWGSSSDWQSDATITEQWTVNYVPAIPLQINGPVNSGTLDISGTLNWTRGEEQLSLVITTPTPLEYEASCTDTVQRIRNGELRAAGDFGDNMVGFVRVRWNGCGQDPTIGFGVK